MTTRRTPRAHLSHEALGDDPAGLPGVSPVLVEWLEREFPVELSPSFGGGAPYRVADDQAEQRGRQQVIDRLRQLSLNQE